MNSGSWSWTGRPDVLRFMGLWRVRHDWATELNWSDFGLLIFCRGFLYMYSSIILACKFEFQYFGPLMQTTDSLGKALTLGKIEGRRRRGCQRMRWLDGITWANFRRWWGTERPDVLQSMQPQSDTTGWLNNNKMTIFFFVISCILFIIFTHSVN